MKGTGRRSIKTPWECIDMAGEVEGMWDLHQGLEVIMLSLWFSNVSGIEGEQPQVKIAVNGDILVVGSSVLIPTEWLIATEATEVVDHCSVLGVSTSEAEGTMFHRISRVEFTKTRRTHQQQLLMEGTAAKGKGRKAKLGSGWLGKLQTGEAEPRRVSQGRWRVVTGLTSGDGFTQRANNVEPDSMRQTEGFISGSKEGY